MVVTSHRVFSPVWFGMARRSYTILYLLLLITVIYKCWSLVDQTHVKVLKWDSEFPPLPPTVHCKPTIYKLNTGDPKETITTILTLSLPGQNLRMCIKNTWEDQMVSLSIAKKVASTFRTKQLLNPGLLGEGYAGCYPQGHDCHTWSCLSRWSI